MIVQAKLAVAAITLAGSAMLATPVMPDARTEIVVGPYQLILSRRAPQFALAERCLVSDCALVEIVIRPANGPVWRIEF
ncbi:MAG: hypothetical protein CMF74_05605 [Maricaulis sp.]|jgi:hypothetical protein|nr:hypothetical protein [Maricaulis sp.]HAQ35562.1 hypothetical protein [Alphaproteobacteria bacterium]|tara:strand:- start:42 stop:278 length:237 start_codon:yes stop_codon:yes gene_type:complete